MTIAITRAFKFDSDARAATLLRRYEHKYLVPESLLPALRRLIAPFTTPDAHATRGAGNGSRQYVVRSIYFDSPQLMHYQESEEGVDFRVKPRIRGYDELESDSVVFLELKRRRGTMTSKERVPVPFDDLRELFAGRAERLRDARRRARHFLFHLRRDALRPVLLVVYDREPYVGVFEQSLRLTFDRHMRSVAWPRIGALFAERHARPSLRGFFTLEVKHDEAFGFPVWLRRFIAERGLVRQALSKYWTCGTDQQIARTPLAVRRSLASV
jgi:hypothetical protein